MIEELTLGEWMLILLILTPMGMFLWGLVIIALIRIFRGEW